MIAKKALAIDGNSLLFRCFYATGNMLGYYHKNNLIPANAIRLMISTIFKLLQNNDYAYVFVAFDAHRQTFRNKIISSYKANRHDTPDDLIIQLNWMKKILTSMGIYHFALDNFEADDLIGSYAKLMNNNNVVVDIYSSDKDLLQLVCPMTNYCMYKSGITNTLNYTNDNFSSLFYGLQPKQIIDFKAIVGDNSDNFVGIKGIGPKTAINLLKKYGSLTNIFNHLSELPLSQQQKFLNDKVNGENCYKIATIKVDLFLHEPINKFLKKEIDQTNFKQILTQLKLNKLEKYLINN